MKQVFDMVYCLQCKSLVPVASAELTFRTGFYKVKIPLGRCDSCAQAEQAAREETERYHLALMA
jgi:hypothetical protein